MKKIKWVNNLNTGIDEIDVQHRVLIEYINQLKYFLEQDIPASKDEIYKCISDIWSFSALHFNSEEMLMRDYEYPYYHDHRMNHKHILNSIKRIRDKVKEKQEIDKSDINSFHSVLINWFSQETLPFDLKLAEFLRERVGFGKKLKRMLKKRFSSSLKNKSNEEQKE